MPKIIKSNDYYEGVKSYELDAGLEELAKQMELAKQNGASSERPRSGNSFNDAIEAALEQSEEILAVARSEGERLKEEARKVGYEEGLKQGREAGYRQAYEENIENFDNDREAIKTRIMGCIADMEIQKQKLLDIHLEELKNISVAVAEKVIKVSLKNSGDIIKRMIIAATEKLKKTQWAKIYISRYDAELMMEGDAKLLNSLSFLSDNIKIITMDREESGTCIVELPKEIIDVSVNTQLENINEILNNVQL